VLTAVLASLTIATTLPAPAAASTSVTDMEQMILAKMNTDRVSRGLVSYRGWSALTSLARYRAGRMASKRLLSHAAAGSLSSSLNARGIQWYGYGEIIGMSSGWGSSSASSIYTMWKNSSSHRSLMFSSGYNYAGVGVARASNGATWVSVVFTDSRDHTAPVVSNGSLTVSGTTLYFDWSGRDTPLQTRTAGLRSFDVQYRTDGGSWHLVRDNITSTSLVALNRVPGHTYSFRVQSADRRGNLSAWTTEVKAVVP
jgi:uncharacterized protein YkwD